MTRRIDNLLTEIRDTLQDKQKTRWTDQELYRYIDQAVRNIALATKYFKVKHVIHVNDPADPNPPHTDYELPYEAIEFYRISNAENPSAEVQPHEPIDSKTIRFPENKEQRVMVDYYAFPNRIYYGATSELDLDEDLFDAVRFFVLYRAYQKEASTENIQKAQYFKGEFASVTAMHSTRWHGKFEVETTRKDYYL